MGRIVSESEGRMKFLTTKDTKSTKDSLTAKGAKCAKVFGTLTNADGR